MVLGIRKRNGEINAAYAVSNNRMTEVLTFVGILIFALVCLGGVLVTWIEVAAVIPEDNTFLGFLWLFGFPTCVALILLLLAQLIN